jgi:hypothetical protein
VFFRYIHYDFAHLIRLGGHLLQTLICCCKIKHMPVKSQRSIVQGAAQKRVIIKTTIINSNAEISDAFHVSLILATCPAHRSVLDFTLLTTLSGLLLVM